MDFPERLVLDPPPVTHHVMPFLTLGEGGRSGYRNMPFAHAGDRRRSRGGRRAVWGLRFGRGSSCRASRTSDFAKIDNAYGSRSSSGSRALAISTADARVSPLVISFITALDAAVAAVAAAGSRAPLGDPVLLLEFF